MEHTVGMILGMVSGAAVALVALKLLLRKKVIAFQFDERQMLARGRAYRNGFVTMLVCVAVWGVTGFAGQWCDTLTGASLCMAVSLVVFAVTCIRRGAYLSLREQPKNILWLLAVVAAGNLLIGAMLATSGSLVVNGVLTYRAINLIMGAVAVILLVVFWETYRRERSEES